MSVTHALIQLLGGLVLLAAVRVASGAAGAAPREPKLADDLGEMARLTIFFGHQSVGGNVLDGVKRLAAQEGVTLRIVETQSLGGLPAGACAHGLIGENGNPGLKIQGFERALDTAPATGVDVAFMKLCYVDFHEGTDPRALFARYREALARLERRHPGTTFVHVTTPLTAAQGGLKALAKRLLGRETSERQNARREQYNALMREAYQGKQPLFDLARIESTRPDGGAETVTWEGKPVPALVAAYTDDGGHLNAQGQERVARELVALLASLARARASLSGGSR